MFSCEIRKLFLVTWKCSTLVKLLLSFLWLLVYSNLQHECKTRAMQERHKRHEWDTNATQTIRLRYECYTNDTSATRVKKFDFDNDTSENIFSNLYIYYKVSERLQGEELFHSNNHILEMPCSYAKLYLKSDGKSNGKSYIKKLYTRL